MSGKKFKWFTIVSWGEKINVHVEEHVYSNQQVCLILVDDSNAPYTTVTRAVERYRPPTSRHALIKNSDENAGLLEQLEVEGIVERTGLRIPSGYYELDEVIVKEV